METITLLLLLGIAALLVFIAAKITKNKPRDLFDPTQISQEVLLGLYEKIGSLQSAQNIAIADQVDKMQTALRAEVDKINQHNSEFRTVLEERVGNLKTDLQQSIGDNLLKVQESIQDKLQKNILVISDMTKIELQKVRESTHEKLDLINLDVQKRLDENFSRNIKSFEEVTKNLGQMEQKAQIMIESTKSIDRLNQIFARTSVKSFGSFAEDYLENLLTEYLTPNSWSKQERVPNSTEVIDFVIEIGDHKIGIDAKFPLTKYQDYALATEDQDQKKREYHAAILQMSQSIASKYYQNNFVHKLFLYLPSETMYTDCIENDLLIQKIQKLKVSILSPNTLFAQLILFNQMQSRYQVSENAEEIIAGLSKIGQNVKNFRIEYGKLGDKLRLAQQNYDTAEKNLIGVENNIYLLEQTKG